MYELVYIVDFKIFCDINFYSIKLSNKIICYVLLIRDCIILCGCLLIVY